MKIKVGDKVKCIRVGAIAQNQIHPPKLKLNGLYVVSEIKSCSCGEVFVDVGIQTSNSLNSRCYCGVKFPLNNVHYCNIKRFVSADEHTEDETQETEYVVVEVDK